MLPTGAIAQGALVADELGLPMCYVRAKAKDHGMGNLIEGTLPKAHALWWSEASSPPAEAASKPSRPFAQPVSKFSAWWPASPTVSPLAAEAFAAANVELTTLTNYEAVVETACRVGYIDESQLPLLARWRANPSTWTPEA